MKKIMISRMISSFLWGIVVSFIVTMVINICIYDGFSYPIIPEFAIHFSSPGEAFLIQVLLMGIISATFGGASIIYEIAEWSFLKQGIIYFLVTTIVWFPIASLCLGMFTNGYAMVGTLITILITYCVIWYIQYVDCRKKIKKINEELRKMN